MLKSWSKGSKRNIVLSLYNHKLQAASSHLYLRQAQKILPDAFSLSKKMNEMYLALVVCMNIWRCFLVYNSNSKREKLLTRLHAREALPRSNHHQIPQGNLWGCLRPPSWIQRPICSMLFPVTYVFSCYTSAMFLVPIKHDPLNCQLLQVGGHLVLHFNFRLWTSRQSMRCSALTARPPR